MMALWGVPSHRARLPTYFPGCNPRSLARDKLPCLARSDYGITLKSDGVRYVLFLTTRPSSSSSSQQPVALMVDRSRTMYEVEVLAPADYFVRRTILEGELVFLQPEERERLYLVFDAVLVKGERLVDRPFAERLEAATRCTRASDDLAQSEEVEAKVLEADALAMVHYDPTVRMRPKTFVQRAFAAKLWADRNSSEHRVDGLVLQDLRAPYTYGTANDDSVFKWKEHSTVDLAGPPEALRASDGPLPDTLCDRCVRVAPSRVVGEEGSVVEYHLSVTQEEVVLFAVRTRVDKGTANGLRVVQATAQDVLDAITPEDLVSVP